MERIAVYGTGTIGSCEATLITGHGFPCVVIGHSEQGLERCRRTIAENWDDLIAQGVTTAEDIDLAVKYAVGMRYASIGLLEYFDAVGFELEKAIAENVYPDLCDTKEIQQIVLDGIAAGETGQKAGRGLFDWSGKDADDFRIRKQSPYFDGVRKWTMPE